MRQEAEERIREEKEKREYIRQEAERLLREEKLLEAERTKQEPQVFCSEVTTQESHALSPDSATTYRTEVIIPSVQSVKENSPLQEISDQVESDDMEGVFTEKERRNKNRKMMVFDPETGCYRKRSDSDDKENVTSPEVKTERVEYRFHLRSDEKRGKATEAKDSPSKPDEVSEDFPVSVRTEQSIAIHGKNRLRSEDGNEEDLKKAGDVMKAKFEEGRKTFEEEPYERKRSDSSKQRTARQISDDSLEEKIREMEKRRERLLLKGPSMELGKRRPSDEGKDLTPRDDPESPNRSKSPADDTAKKPRSRSERIKRRLTAEEMSLKKSSSEEDLPERNRRSSDTAKVPKTDEKITPTKKETFKIQLNRIEKPEDEISVTQVKPVEAGSGDLMSWDDDSTDGPTSVPEKDPPAVFRKRADSMEGETFPKPVNLMEVEAPITVTRKGNVESTPVATGSLLDLDEDSSMSAPVLESISTWDNRARVSNTVPDDDRRRREKEHAERKRRIEENQRVAKELKAKRQSGSDFNAEKPRNEEPVREMSMKEKRRSLVDMWESFSEPQTNVISFEETEEIPPQQSKTILARENRTISFDRTEDNNNEEEMEVDDKEKFSPSRPIPAVRNKKVSDEEQRWESAENFQPGRLQKTVFHSLSEADPTVEEPKAKPRKGPSRYDWMKGESFADQEALVPTKLKVEVKRNEATDEIPRKDPAKDDIPKRMPRKMEIPESSSEDSESESEGESASEEERKPRIDTDEYHKLTQEETQWESAGHFQPKKLNAALMASFLQADAADSKPMPKKTQEMPKKHPQTSPEQTVVVSVKAQKDEIEVQEISPVNEAKTETEPYTPGTYTYEEESSDSEDDIPGWRKVEEQRRQQEREEIERAKLEEKRRMEREAMEEEKEEKDTDSSDDEFEAKVRTKEVRRINPNLLSQFMKEPEKEPEKPLKSAQPKEQRIEVSNVPLIESTPSSDSSTEEENQEQNVEDEYEEKVKSGQVRKLNLENSPFLRAKEEDHVSRDVPRSSRVVVQEERYVQKVESTVVESEPSRDVGRDFTNEPEIITYVTSTKQSSEDESSEDDAVPGWRKVEENRRKQEQEELARAKLEEQRRRERDASGSEKEEEADSTDDEFDAKVRTKEIRKINPNLLVQFMGESGGKEKPPSAKRPQKETIEIKRVQSKESSSSEDSDVEDIQEKGVHGEDDGEYDQKVKSGQVRKLVLSNSPFTQQSSTQEPQVVQKRSQAGPEKERIELQRVESTDTSSSEESEVEDLRKKDINGDDEYEQKVKSGQVRRLVFDNSPFMQTTTKEEPQVIQRRPVSTKRASEPKHDSRTAVVQEEVLVQLVDTKVVESEPDLVYHEPKEDDEYEEKVKSRLVKKLSQDQFGFLRKQEEEERKRAQEEERRRIEREEREKLKKEEEHRRRLEAQKRAKEEELMRRQQEMMRIEEETRRREEDERARKESERRRKLEEAERARQEEEERIRREEEEEQMRFEEMRRQKHAAKMKFESGVFDGITITHSEKDIHSVGRLDSNKFMQFQQSSQEEPKLKTKKKEKEKKVVEEYKAPEPKAEAVVMAASVDLIETSPYDDAFERVHSEDLEYEEKRKSVGKLDRDWYIKQQLKQAEEHDRRARELEEQRLREERNEMLRLKEDTSSKQWQEDGPSEERKDRSDSEKQRSKLSEDKLSLFEQESRQEPKKSRKQKEGYIKVEKRDEVETAPLFFEESRQNEKRKSMSSEEGSVTIMTRDDDLKSQQKLRLQREKEETELLRREEERRRLASEEESYGDERDSDKPKNVGKLNQDQFAMFQQGQGEVKAKTRKQAPQKVQEVISVQNKEDVESSPVTVDYYVGPTVTQEDAEYEQRINTGKRLDVDKFFNFRSQEEDEKRQRSKKVAEERMRQEQEELARLRAEEKKRLKRMQEELDEGYVEESTGDRYKTSPTTNADFNRPQKISIERRTSQPEEPEAEKPNKGVSVGRLPKELCSTFEGEKSKADGSDTRRKSSKSKGSRSRSSGDSHSRNSRSSSSDNLSYVPQDRSVNGSVSPRETKYLEGQSGRRDSSKETQDISIESYSPEEKPVPKKLQMSMLAAFQKSETEPEVQLRRAKSEKRARPKSIGNVDLLRWQDDSNLQKASSGTSKKEKAGRQPRPKSIAY